MKRALLTLMCLTAMVLASTGIKAQEVTIPLMPGWNWISYPSTDTVDFATALGSFTPVEGDMIENQYAFSVYSEGEWFGDVQQFYPGYGYLYYSSRTVPVFLTFNAQQPAPQVVVTTSEPMLITAISAMGGGEVTVSDGTYILVKGLCWASHENPTTNDDFYQEAESGVGSFSLSMTNLNISTTYYVRAYAVTPNGTVYGGQKTFTTRDGIPTLTTAEVTDITGTTATCGGNITDDGGGLAITARGVCCSTSPNPTIADLHTTNGSGTGSFNSNITGLDVSTTYYVRAYATTVAGTAYGDEKAFTTRDGIPALTTTEVTSIGSRWAYSGGNITDDGGGLAITARGVCWSASPNPTLTDPHTTDGSGAGSFTSCITGLDPNTTYYVRAYATTNAGTGYGNQLSFIFIGSNPPIGAIDGPFSVSESQHVYFSQGNLQYQASTNTWCFAESQWDYVGTQNPITGNPGGTVTGSDNSDISSIYSGWIDLFGWGTSGYNHGANCYQPWSTSTSFSDYFAYGSEYNQYNLYDQTGQADWGYNPISNGGNQEDQWRTLTEQEWQYVFNARTTTSGIRYAKANVNNVNGVIMLPDDWSTSTYSLSNTNTYDASFNSNTLTASQWSTLEQAGAVFLPAAGSRNGTSVGGVGSYGCYWSASRFYHSHADGTYFVNFSDSDLVTPAEYGSPWYGFSVRLVQ